MRADELDAAAERLERTVRAHRRRERRYLLVFLLLGLPAVILSVLSAVLVTVTA